MEGAHAGMFGYTQAYFDGRPIRRLEPPSLHRLAKQGTVPILITSSCHQAGRFPIKYTLHTLLCTN